MNVRLAANFIQNTDWNGNWGHLQIVNGASNDEIEVQVFNFNQIDGFGFFRYVEIRDVALETDGYGNRSFYREIDLSLGERTAEDFWSTLSAIHETFRAQTPNYLYNLGQNSNSYVNTLLWMVGIDLAPLISGVRPSTVTGMDPIAAGVAATTFSNGNPIEWAQWYQLLTSPFPGSDRNLLTNGYGPGTEIIFQLALTQSPETYQPQGQ